VPFLMIPQVATIAANETYEVKIVFQPDFASNHFFDMLLIDIPNQINPKHIYLRGQSHDRQLSVRIYEPFDWRPKEELKRNYEKPLELLNATAVASGEKKRIVLQYLRDEEAITYEYKFKADQNRIR